MSLLNLGNGIVWNKLTFSTQAYNFSRVNKNKGQSRPLFGLFSSLSRKFLLQSFLKHSGVSVNILQPMKVLQIRVA